MLRKLSLLAALVALAALLCIPGPASAQHRGWHGPRAGGYHVGPGWHGRYGHWGRGPYFWGGRWYTGYGVGPCWIWGPGYWVWNPVCGPYGW